MSHTCLSAGDGPLCKTNPHALLVLTFQVRKGEIRAVEEAQGQVRRRLREKRKQRGVAGAQSSTVWFLLSIHLFALVAYQVAARDGRFYQKVMVELTLSF